MIFFILTLDEEGIAKLASTFQLFIFMLVNLAVIVMRESHISSYDPGYRSPLYPWMQIFGIITSLLLIVYMGWLAILFTAGIVVVCLIWYYHYARPHVTRDGAIYHWFQRLGRRQDKGLDREFRGIMKEKGLRNEDPFDEIVARSSVLDLNEETSFENVIEQVAELLARRLPKTAEEIKDRFMQGTLMGATPVTRGVALPHFRTSLIDQPEMVLVRSKHSIKIPADDLLTEEVESAKDVHAVFFLVSPEHNPGQHLRILAQIAGRVDESSFAEAWSMARDEQKLREILLRDERFLTIRIRPDTPAMALAGKALKELQMPTDSLIALIRRGHNVIIPHGNTVLEQGDRLTVIGEPKGLQTLQQQYVDS